VGIGDNPLLAKLALDNEAKKNPCQRAYWSYENVPETIWKIPKLTDMWGISRGYEKKLNNLGITNIYSLAHTNPKVLERSLGIMGLQLFYHSHGVDYSRLSERAPSKSKSFGKVKC
jgi:DNA polymerase V